MRRILRIEKCLDCPHCEDFICCHPDTNCDRNHIDNWHSIPEWCPLEVEE